MLPRLASFAIPIAFLSERAGHRITCMFLFRRARTPAVPNQIGSKKRDFSKWIKANGGILAERA